MDTIEEIKKLKALLDQGAISEEEFNLLKKNILSQENASNDQQKNHKQVPLLDVHDEAEKSSVTNNIISPEIDKTNKVFEEGNEISFALARIGLGAIIILSIIFWIRYNSFLGFLITAIVAIGSFYSIGKYTLKVKKRNIYFGLFIVVSILLIAIPIGKNSSSSSSEQSSQTPQDDDAKYVRDYIIGHYFEDNENGVEFTLKFSGENYGWFGIMEFNYGSCTALYRYETKGRNINLTFNSSTCTSQGGSTTAHFNSDNSISFYIHGQEFQFKPL